MSMVRDMAAWPRCAATGKIRYSSEQQARRACSALHARIRVYRCNLCHGVHVAATEKR